LCFLIFFNKKKNKSNKRKPIDHTLASYGEKFPLRYCCVLPAFPKREIQPNFPLDQTRVDSIYLQIDKSGEIKKKKKQTPISLAFFLNKKKEWGIRLVDLKALALKPTTASPFVLLKKHQR